MLVLGNSGHLEIIRAVCLGILSESLRFRGVEERETGIRFGFAQLPGMTSEVSMEEFRLLCRGRRFRIFCCGRKGILRESIFRILAIVYSRYGVVVEFVICSHSSSCFYPYLWHPPCPCLWHPCPCQPCLSAATGLPATCPSTATGPCHLFPFYPFLLL